MVRKKCQTTILAMADEQAQLPITFPWIGDRFLSFYELLLDTMRHVQEHAAQLNLFLGQQQVAGVTGWVAKAKADEGGARCGAGTTYRSIAQRERRWVVPWERRRPRATERIVSSSITTSMPIRNQLARG